MSPKMVELGEKRLFILVSAGGLVLLAVLAGAAWYLIAPRLSELHPDLPRTVGAAAGVVFAFIALGLGLIALSALTGRRVVFGLRVTATVVRILFPLVLMLSSLIRVDKDEVKRSFVAVNNALVMAGRGTIRGGRLLLLLPHCLQATTCPHKITGGLIDNCRGCGECVIAGLLDLAHEKGLPLTVATGGTLARRVIGEVDPAAIVAVACETDLTSGIRDSYPLPVYGVLNIRPHGPCRDTTVDMEQVRTAVRLFAGRE
ncbi:MAG: DUF116 domain-containing protein [Candidatus Eisenbacteria bacterium]